MEISYVYRSTDNICCLYIYKSIHDNHHCIQFNNVDSFFLLDCRVANDFPMNIDTYEASEPFC